MIYKNIDSITKADIDTLIENQVAESRTLDYKRELPGNLEADKKEFLADVSAFANSAGGDILYGIAEEKGVASAAVGVEGNLDAEIMRMEGTIQTGLEPRIPGVRFTKVPGFEKGSVLLLRIPRSWAAPHMVKFQGLSKFYARDSARKYQMDVNQIRASFLASESLNEKIRDFHLHRVRSITEDKGPIFLGGVTKSITHVVPIASIAKAIELDMKSIRHETETLNPPNPYAVHGRLNIDGYLKFNYDSQAPVTLSFCQIYRTGVIEAAWSDFSEYMDDNNAHVLWISHFEENMILFFEQVLTFFKQNDIPAPIVILSALINADGYKILPQRTLPRHSFIQPIDRKEIFFPEIWIDDFNVPAYTMMRPMFDALWNSSGFERCYNYDEEGKWLPR